MTTRLLLRGQLAYMREQGFEVIAVASPGWDLEEAGRQEGVQTIALPIERDLSPLRDFVSLVRLFFLLRRLRPAIVHTGTPKASLLGMLAAWATRAPVRIYALKGLRLETLTGWRRGLLAITERITARCATCVFCESPSLREVYLQHGFVKPEKAKVIGPGLPNGLDAARFDKESFTTESTQTLRESLKLPSDSFVIGFVGRFVRDKGILEFYQAFEQVLQKHPKTYLLLVGDFESGDPVPAEVVEKIESHPQIVQTGFIPDTAPYYQLMQLHALPSYREGFPNTPMEAAAAGVPTVGFVATGTVDAVQDGVTGTLVPCGDASALTIAIERYLEEPELLRQHAAAARERAHTDFRREPIWEATLAEYVRLLAEQGISMPNQVPCETVSVS